VGVSVEHQVGPGAIDCVTEQIAAEERVDLESLTLEGILE
jgi:hypothetical protein